MRIAFDGRPIRIESIAILILNHDGKSHLDTCLSSVLEQVNENDHVYLVDNGSTDGSVGHVAKYYPRVRIIEFETNLGFALAYNRAVAVLSEEVILFLNNDVEVDRGWLGQLKVAVHGSPSRAILGSKILLYNNRGVINHAGGSLTLIGGGIDLDFMNRERRRTEETRFVGCVSGASMMIPRRVFLDLGGFDSDFFAYFEDVDLCWRAWLAGYRVLFQPSSRVYHKLSSTMGPRLTPERVFLGEKNRLQTVLKNLELPNAVAGLFSLAVFNTIRLTHFLSSRKPKTALAILRGDWWVFAHLPTIISKRSHIQQRRKIGDRFLLKYGLMIGLADGVREFIRLAASSNE